METPSYITVGQCSSDFEREVIASLATLKTQITSVVGNGQPGRLTKLEERVSFLERVHWKTVGASSTVGAIVGAAFTYLPKILGH
jgi:uncharacterized metal-binding protein